MSADFREIVEKALVWMGIRDCIAEFTEVAFLGVGNMLY